jgi:hypothetical protein
MTDVLWQDHEVRILRQGHLVSTASEIAELLGRSIAAVATKATSIGVRFYPTGSDNISEAGPQTGKRRFPDGSEYLGLSKTESINYLLSKKPDQLTVVEANVAHLIDLKRAGHSPALTEANIPNDDGLPWRFVPEPFCDYRSPAASCIEG